MLADVGMMVLQAPQQTITQESEVRDPLTPQAVLVLPGVRFVLGLWYYFSMLSPNMFSSC